MNIHNEGTHNKLRACIIFSLAFSLICLCLSSLCHATPTRGIKRVVKNGNQVLLYEESHALVIGVSRYTGGWPVLPGVEQDIRDVKAALEKHGFKVTTVLDPDKTELDQAFGTFINRHGKGANNRLLFYFAGHGYTHKPKWGKKKYGYLIPKDAPTPDHDAGSFKLKSLSMKRIEEYAYDIEAKHAVFIFDSCFSGSLLSMVRAVPEDINKKSASPVRQFLTSGDETEKVPDKSIFKAQFVAALNGEGDLNKDGYITGTELGGFLQNKVAVYSRDSQHPQYGTIRNPELDKGDFIFILPEDKNNEQNTGIVKPQPHDRTFISQGPDPENELWQEVKNSNDLMGYRYYLSKYPDGKYTDTARFKIKNLEKKDEQESKGSITVKPTPMDSLVRILNIGPKYKDGIELEAGTYHIEVTANGYERYRKWITLESSQNLALSVDLKKKAGTTINSISHNGMSENESKQKSELCNLVSRLFYAFEPVMKVSDLLKTGLSLLNQRTVSDNDVDKLYELREEIMIQVENIDLNKLQEIVYDIKRIESNRSHSETKLSKEDCYIFSKFEQMRERLDKSGWDIEDLEAKAFEFDQKIDELENKLEGNSFPSESMFSAKAFCSMTGSMGL